MAVRVLRMSNSRMLRPCEKKNRDRLHDICDCRNAHRPNQAAVKSNGHGEGGVVGDHLHTVVEL